MLLEHARDPGDRAASTHTGDEMGDAAVRLPPDFGAGRGLVGGWIGRVEVLVGLESAGDLACESLGDAVVALRALARHRRGADDDFGAVRAQQGDLFARHLVGHDADEAIALECGGDGQAGAGVARGGLDDGRARVQVPGLFGRLDHRQTDAVLDRPARVEALDFGNHRRARIRGQARQTYQRGVAHCVENRLEDLGRHGASSEHTAFSPGYPGNRC